MSILAVVYASAPTDEVIIPALEIAHETIDPPIRVCSGFEDQTVMLETSEEATFTAAGIAIALPAKNTSGQQNLSFGIDNVTGEAQRALEGALEAGGPIAVTLRIYLASDLSAPAETPLVLTLTGAEFDGTSVVVTAGFNDLLNSAWPRRRYTADFAPGLKYIS